MGGRGCFQTLFYQNGIHNCHSIQTRAYLNLYDVNSLYPSVMTSYICGRFFIKGHQKIYDALFQSKQLGFIEEATALVVSICQYFPVKHKISGDDRLIYPLGTFVGVV
jgi:hypothetical protein